ncbi:protein disulfide isomerase [Histomonas meleagridis]|uniref:protein disulfide isomerase n=1 Tax=Histomonas meleagridis TaxID=135588 RepID=UPI00355A2C21|nr:protein disulfide isomerase [Histomonas meleagridis]KAH0801422.1 protein disulfide isomerase [Histomonas meleagridis]
MLLFLFSFSLSIFVPYENTAIPAVMQLNEITFSDFKPKREVLISMIIPDNSFDETQMFLLTFAKVASFFSRIAEFAYFKLNEAQSIMAAIPVQAPALVLFFNGRLAFSCPFPSTEKELIFLISSWLDPNNKVTETTEELYNLLGNVKLSLICEPRNGAQASFLVTRTLPYIDSCNVILSSRKVMDEVGLNGSDYGLFRLKDMTILPIGHTTTSLYNSSRPYYSHIDSNTMKTRNEIFGVYIDEQYNETIHNKLYEIGENNKEFMIGVLEAKDIKYVKDVVRKGNITIPTFIVFSYINGFYYPTNETFNIADNDFTIKVNEYLHKIKNNEIKRKYYSEKIPKKQEYEYVTKIVGKTYSDFLNDNENDVAVLYYDPQNHKKHLLEFIEAAKIIYNGKNNIKLGYINVRDNSSPVPFPYVVNSPHLELFPLLNKTNSEPMFETPSKKSYLRFIKKHMSLPNSIDVEPITKNEAQIELFAFSMRTQKLPQRQREKAKIYLESLEELVKEK